MTESARSCQPAWRYKVSNPPPHLKPWYSNSTNENIQNNNNKNISRKLWLTVAWWYLNLICHLVSGMSALFHFPLSSQCGWRYIYVWISQWIYYDSSPRPCLLGVWPRLGTDWWTTWASVISSVTCFKTMEWQISAKNRRCQKDEVLFGDAVVTLPWYWRQQT